MKKMLVVKCLLGESLGLTISTAISIFVSLAAGDGSFYAVVPALIDDCGTEINAVIVQSLCSMLYGAVWAGASEIWRKEDWSLFRQTATHLVLCSLATFPVAWFMRWMEHSLLGVRGVLSYFGIFLGIYFVIWISQYSSIKRRIQQINEKMQKENKN